MTTLSKAKTVAIAEEVLTDKLDAWILEHFAEHALDVTGVDGDIRSFTFTVREEDALCGILTAKSFWGSFCLRRLLVLPEFRGEGFGRFLVEKSFEKARELGCTCCLVETLSFQAKGFYEKLGFEIEFTRSGYDEGVEYHYLKKEL